MVAECNGMQAGAQPALPVWGGNCLPKNFFSRLFGKTTGGTPSFFKTFDGLRRGNAPLAMPNDASMKLSELFSQHRAINETGVTDFLLKFKVRLNMQKDYYCI